ncbi:MAG TPA: hypothetical protein VNV66_20130 [Pilimelia sp.]|nr:hypothetical protein [Pilimelia sp.]
MSGPLRVLRLHLLAWPGALAWELGILALAFAANLVIFGTIRDQMDSDPVTGGLTSVYAVVLVASVQLSTQMFPFALGLSVTRRVFFAGTALLIVAHAVALGALLTGLRAVERATDGWGMSLNFFAPGFLAVEGPLGQLLIYTGPLLLVSFLGLFGGAVGKRWGQSGLLTLWAVVVIVPAVVVTLLTAWRAWDEVGGWLAAQSPVGLVGGVPAVLALGFGAAAFVVLRRATP